MPHHDPRDQLVSEELFPTPGSGMAAMAARGEPALPQAFTWRDTPYRVAAVKEVWKTTGPCRHGSGEQYVRRHWYRIVTDPPAEMTVYCDRQARRGQKTRSRWWVYTVRDVAAADDRSDD